MQKLFQYHYVYEPIDWQGSYKSYCRDFKVREILQPSLEYSLNSTEDKDSSDYEHLWLYIKKTNLNTETVKKYLSIYFEIEMGDISYAGLKDKYAITEQWFSIRLPGGKKKIDSNLLLKFNLSRYIQIINPATKSNNSTSIPSECVVLKARWFKRKIQKVDIQSNQFKIQIRSEQEIPESLFQRIKDISASGFANYFGHQRFGINGANINKAEQYFTSKGVVEDFHKGLMLSTARAYLFNKLLSLRINHFKNFSFAEEDTFYDEIADRYLHKTESNANKLVRFHKGEIHPCLLLYGLGASESLQKLHGLDINGSLFNQDGVIKKFCQGLEEHQVKPSFRPIRSIPRDLSYTQNKEGITIIFNLSRGSYATVFLEQLAFIKPAKRVD